jgi:ABC-type transporter MlaC component
MTNQNKALSVIVLTLLLASTAISADAQATVQAHMECVMSRAAKIDDGQMGASSLAKLILPFCHVEHEAAMNASSTQAWRTTPKEQAQKLELDHTTAAVQFYRARVRGRAPNSN